MAITEIIAHRGASYDAPENTLAAINLAWQQQAEAAEIDIHLSQDRAIVVMHDDNTLRTTGCNAKIASLTLEELQQLDAGSWKDSSFNGQRIPILDEILAIVPPHKRLYIEVKGRADEIIAPLKVCLGRSDLLAEQIFLVGFDYDLMRQIKATLPAYGVLWIQGVPHIAQVDKVIERCRNANFDGLSLSYGWPIDESFVRRVGDADLKLSVWTVDDGDIARSLVAAGVTSITTNRPAWLREQLHGSTAKIGG
jgi:glycerophosphoryl diester phosphodiesterase